MSDFRYFFGYDAKPLMYDGHSCPSNAGGFRQKRVFHQPGSVDGQECTSYRDLSHGVAGGRAQRAPSSSGVPESIHARLACLVRKT